ncbi:MAG: hypothetical protein ACLGH3_03970 [Actinomycetota bacterium]
MLKAVCGFALAVASLLPGGALAVPDDHGMNDPTGCPGHYCRNYRLRCAWFVDRPDLDQCKGVSSSLIRVEYWINPSNVWGIPREEIAKWFAYAGRTWEYTNPRLRFKLLGFTDELAIPNDGKNIIAFQLLAAPTPAAGAVVFSQGNWSEWDMWLNLYHEPVWLPCRFDCGRANLRYWGGLQHPLEDRELRTLTRLEIGTVIMHEFGHVLGLDHPSPTEGREPRCVTMDPEGYCEPDGQSYERYGQSPALAELLGVRELYPYRCPKAPKGVKKGDRSWMDWRYRRVCPTIKVAVP